MRGENIAVMSALGKMIGVWMTGRTVAHSTPILLRLLLGMAALLACAVMAAFFTVLLIAGMLWLLYSQLTLHGADPYNALLAVAGILVALVAASAWMTHRYWRTIKFLSKRMVYHQAPISGRVSALADSFIDGFVSPGRSPSP